VSETRDIVERINHRLGLTVQMTPTTRADGEMLSEAAATITALRAERDGLREALEKISQYDRDRHPDCPHCCSETARAALAAGQDRDGAEGKE